MTGSHRLFELPEPPVAPTDGGAQVAAPAERQLTLLPGGAQRRPEWWLSPQTRVVGKRGVADARAALDRSVRGRTGEVDQTPARRAG